MRQQIDCAVLNLSMHSDWLEDSLKSVEPAMSRIRMHKLDWETVTDLTGVHNDVVNVDIHAFAQASVSLRRYDVCLVPVSLGSLSWTRQALAAIPRGPFLPLIGVLKGLRSAAMQDLIELGLADFLRFPLCPEESRARILSTVSRVPRPGSLREPEPAYAVTEGHIHERIKIQPWLNPKNSIRTQRSLVKSGNVLLNASHNRNQSDLASVSFRQSKASVVEQFEREYITRALELHRGNIAMAARASQKHRRAFWALMRKYQIDPVQYRPEDDAE